MIEHIHALGLWLGGLRLLGLALPLWLMALAGALVLGFPALQRGLERALALLLPLLVIGAVALCFGLVVARYGLGRGSIAAQEAMQWLHALAFMLGAGWALRHGRHVRVDALSARFSARTRARIEALGHVLLLLPFAGFLLWISLDYVAASWQMREASREPGGLPGLFLLKAAIPLAAWLLAVESARQLLVGLRAAFAGGARA
jgi:TRAP-type mannitol/chloroaromatic compound transport system permease small subunit